MEALLERLPFEQSVLEGIAEGADGVGEDVVEHVRRTVGQRSDQRKQLEGSQHAHIAHRCIVESGARNGERTP